MAETPRRDPTADTTQFLRRARAGDEAALTALVVRLHPLLLAMARRRLGPGLTAATGIAIDDLAQDVWAVTLPKIDQLPERDGRTTPVLLRFLATTLFNRIRELTRSVARHGTPTPLSGPADGISASVTGALTHAADAERRSLVRAALDSLPADEHELLVLRGLEGHPYAELSVLLHASENSLAQRYRRALAHLKAALPSDVFDELDAD